MPLKKVNINIWVGKDLDEFFRRLTKKVVDIDGRQITFEKSRADLYRQALEFAVERVNEWYK